MKCLLNFEEFILFHYQDIKKKHYQTSLEFEQELMQEQKEELEKKDKTTFRVFS